MSALKQYINGALVHLQASYCLSSLGSKIKIEVVDFLKHPFDVVADFQGIKDTLQFTQFNLPIQPGGPGTKWTGVADLMIVATYDKKGWD